VSAAVHVCNHWLSERAETRVGLFPPSAMWVFQIPSLGKTVLPSGEKAEESSL